MAYHITYENDDLVIREIEAKDKAIIETWYHDKYQRDYPYTSMDGETDWFHAYEQNPSELILIADEKKKFHQPIGVVKLIVMNKKHVKMCGYIIGEKLAKGNGYSHAILSLAHDYVFTELYPKYICLEVETDNRPAVGTYIKAGYKINELFVKDGKDMYFMRILNPRYYEAVDENYN
ncbi:GNAT family N-acetyltransferase [Vallitalea pronyensis]|uniref:GNAT family N-acetyltransferase n=1 Tax=Vallitalea pronyensis TaxID=1348613 RepID=A0A8J8MJY2_9FIRM|nr:GNAT family protein [Vallitalea pronyensis]QUI23030.1 GNAT family N-acetyltransferase [Vallitalea pronyensis]